MEIPEKLKLEYLLALDTHIETVGKENKEITLKKMNPVPLRSEPMLYLPFTSLLLFREANKQW